MPDLEDGETETNGVASKENDEDGRTTVLTGSRRVGLSKSHWCYE